MCLGTILGGLRAVEILGGRGDGEDASSYTS